ncbi:MAG: hypothetical protein ACYS1A_17745 [Planctomycetota bacterium]|jgi:hypothetical protein
MQTTILTNCREFGCANNEKGQCLLAKITLMDDGTPWTGHLICIEAEDRPRKEVKDDKLF